MPQPFAPPVELVPTSKLFCSPSNPRQNDASVPHVAASLRRFGWQQPVVARRTGEVIAGNTRLKAAQQLGLMEVPVWWFDGSDIDAVAYAVADNKTHEFSQWDDAALARLLEQLREEDSLDGVGFDDEEIERLIAGLAAEEGADLDDPGAEPPPAVAVAKPGDLWVLGNHRLLCGDSTKLTDVHRVMAGKAAALVATDPPYLVDYTGERPNGTGKDWTDKYREIDIDDADAFFRSVFANVLEVLGPKAAIYCWHAHKRCGDTQRIWRDLGILDHQQILWVKPTPVFGRVYWHFQHEPCVMGWRQGDKPEHDGVHEHTSVWTVEWDGKAQISTDHPCLHPDALVLTDAGWRAIQTIETGAKVLAADSPRQAVTEVSSHPHPSPDLFRTMAHGSNAVPVRANETRGVEVHVQQPVRTRFPEHRSCAPAGGSKPPRPSPPSAPGSLTSRTRSPTPGPPPAPRHRHSGNSHLHTPAQTAPPRSSLPTGNSLPISRPQGPTLNSTSLLFAVPLALGLAACNGGSSADAIIDPEPPVAPQLGDPLPGLTAEELASFERGRVLFGKRFTPSEGLGPLYNATSCESCHSKPSLGGSAELYRNFYVSLLFGVSPLGNLPSPVIPAFGGITTLQPHSLEQGRYTIPELPGIVVTAQRNSVPIFGVGLFEFVSNDTIMSNADPEDLDGDGISGRANNDGAGQGRLGLKAQSNNIEFFTRAPLMNQMGITSNPFRGEAGTVSFEAGMAPQASSTPNAPTVDDDGIPDPEISPQDLGDLIAFTRFLAPPAPRPFDAAAVRGQQQFTAIGCAKCHIPELPSSRGPVRAYTDLLIHNMGNDLADFVNFGRPQVTLNDPGNTGLEFRTAPLWGVSKFGPYLHDGRAETLDDAIRMHGGEALAVRQAYEALSESDRADLIAFLEHL